MTARPTPPLEGAEYLTGVLKKLTKSIDGSFEGVAKIAGSNLPPSDFYEQFLKRTIDGIQAIAGAVWLRTPQGFLQLQTQKEIEAAGLDDQKGGRHAHNELLRQAFQGGRAMMVEPGGQTQASDGAVGANLTNLLTILAPIYAEDNAVLGILEIWVAPFHDSRIHPTYLNYVVQMAGYASNYHRQITQRKASSSEQVFTQVETFAKQIHSSLNVREVAFQAASEGRRVIGCDRLSVAVRHGKKAKIEAVSGSDVVETGSVQIKRMRKLCDRVIRWGDKLTFTGRRDETLPPRVLRALDAYLAEANPKLLVLLPLRDEREKTKSRLKKPGRSALLMESFDPPEKVEPIISRMEVVGEHVAPALYNAIEHKRVPFKWVWRPVTALQDGLGGKARFWASIILVGLILLTLAMVFIPYTLKIETKGQLLPTERQYVYARTNGTITEFAVRTGDVIRPQAEIAKIQDPDLSKAMLEKISEENMVKRQRETASSSLRNITDQKARDQKLSELAGFEARLKALREEIASYEAIYNSRREKPGEAQVLAPEFPASRDGEPNPRWTVLTPDFADRMLNMPVRPNEPILRVGNTRGSWEIEQKIPQKHLGKVLRAFQTGNGVRQDERGRQYLDVDVLVTSVPDVTYAGRLYRDKVGGEVVPNKDDHNESEPVNYAYVTVNEADLPDSAKIPEQLLVTGVEVKTNIHCGQHPSGYSIFYGVWEFLYEKVVFPF